MWGDKMSKKGSSGNTILIIGGLLAGAYVLSQKGEKSENPLLNIFPGGFGGNGALPDMGGIFDGLTNMLGGVTGNLTDAANSLLSAVGNIPAQFNVPFPEIVNTGGGGGTPPNPNQLNPSGSAIIDLANSANTLIDAARSLAITGVGSYAAYKTLPSILKAAKPGIQLGSKAVSDFAVRTTQTGLNWTSAGINALSKPVAALPKIPVVMAAAASGAAGYAVGSWFNTTSAGQALQNFSGEMGAKFAKTSVGNYFFPAAKVNTQNPTVQLVQKYQAQGMSRQQIITQIGQDRLPVAGSSFNQAKVRIVGGAR